MTTCVIIDDEPAAIAILEKLIAEEAPFLSVLGSATSVDSGKELITSTKPDVVFLDVMLGAKTSFELLESLYRLDFDIIFTTSHDTFAIKAFDYDSIHYLLKPIDKTAFKKAVAKLQAKQSPKNSYQQVASALQLQHNATAKLAIPGKQGVSFVAQKDIAYLESSGSYTEVVMLSGERKLLSQRIGNIHAKLSGSFFRIHRRFIVNLDEVAFLENKNPAILFLNNGDSITVAKAYKSALFERLEQ